MQEPSSENARQPGAHAAVLPVVLAAASVVFASCALDTAGNFTTPPDAAADHAPDGLDADLWVEDGEAPDTPFEVPEVEALCMPGELCPGSGYCCNRNGALGCYESALDCDCSVSEVLCTSQGMACCETGTGVRICKPDTDHCLCAGPEDSARCGEGSICCRPDTTAGYECTAQREGCMCDPGSPSVTAYCGDAGKCCDKGDGPKCHADISGCLCGVAGENLTECGPGASYCCSRGAGMTCGGGPEGCICAGGGDPLCQGSTCCDVEGAMRCKADGENCRCNDHPDCGTGYVCCDNSISDDTKYCHSSACYCPCDQMPGGDCKYLGETMICRIDTYCDKPWGCW